MLRCRCLTIVGNVIENHNNRDLLVGMKVQVQFYENERPQEDVRGKKKKNISFFFFKIGIFYVPPPQTKKINKKKVPFFYFFSVWGGRKKNFP